MTHRKPVDRPMQSFDLILTRTDDGFFVMRVVGWLSSRQG